MKKLFYLLLALPLLVACHNDEPEPSKEAVLKLTSEATMEFAAEGGEGTITYTVEIQEATRNAPVNTYAIEAYCDAEWVENLTVAENTTFTVAANEGDARQTEIVVKYGGKEAFNVVVKQTALADTPAPAFEGWGIVGTINDWGATNAIVLEEVDGYYTAKGVELTTEDKIKFIKDGDNAQNRGGNGQAAEPNYFYTAQLWGSDIYVSEAGRYDIYLNAKEDTYYIMSEGKSPAEALEPLAPGEDLWEVYGNFEGEKMRLTTDKNYMVAKGAKFDSAVAEFVIRVNEGEKVIGAKKSATYNIEEAIAVAEGNDTAISVNVVADATYDIYYYGDKSSVWVMPAGSTPIVWKEVTGVAFSTTNYAIFLHAEGMELNFDFNCSSSSNYIIPEGRYYVIKEDGTSDFNMDQEYVVRINGQKSFPKDGYMEIKHISGGYDITVNMTSIHNHIIKAHYAGPIDDIAIMGRPITNPE